MEISLFLSLLIVASVTYVAPIKVYNYYGAENAVDQFEGSTDYKTENETQSGGSADYKNENETLKPSVPPKKQPPPIPKLAPLIYKKTTYPAPKDDEVQTQAYSKGLQDVYATTQTPSPPIDYTSSPPLDYTEPPAKDIPPKHTLKAEDYRRPIAIKPPPPVSAKSTEKSDPIDNFPIPISDEKTYPQDPDCTSSIPQLSPTYLPPVATVCNPDQYVPPSRGYALQTVSNSPSYSTLQTVSNSPSYSTSFNVAPIAYRTIGYVTPLAYAAVPAPRNLGYAFRSPSGLQVVYSIPSISINNGITPVQYNGLVGGGIGYGNFLKKKRK